MAEGNGEYNPVKCLINNGFHTIKKHPSAPVAGFPTESHCLEHTGQINLGFAYIFLICFFFRIDLYSDELKQKTNFNNAGHRLRYRFTVFPINENKVNCI